MIDYKTFMKHAEKVCKSEHLDEVDRYQILKGIKHLENGDAVVTDSHRLYLAKNIHDRTDGAVINAQGKRLKGAYPDVIRLIPSNNPKQELELSMADLFEVSDSIYSVGKLIDHEKPPKLEFFDDRIQYDSVHVKYHRQMRVTFDEPMCVNAKYLLDAVKMFKAAGCKTLTVKFYGRMRPFTLANEDESLLALILPIRKY